MCFGVCVVATCAAGPRTCWGLRRHVISACGHLSSWPSYLLSASMRCSVRHVISGELAIVPLGDCVRHGSSERTAVNRSSWPPYLLGCRGRLVSVRRVNIRSSWPPYLLVCLRTTWLPVFHVPSEQLATVPAGCHMQPGTITMSLAGATGGSSIICCRV